MRNATTAVFSSRRVLIGLVRADQATAQTARSLPCFSCCPGHPIFINGGGLPGDPDDAKDPTPLVGAAPDVARLSHAEPKPPHERTAAEEAGVANWEAIATSVRFRELLRAKRRFVIPAM